MLSLCTLLALTAVLFTLRLVIRRKKRLPPGPKPLPLLGNTLQFPTKQAWKILTEWKKQYGEIVYAEVFGRPIVILNTSKVSKELLDQRSAIYSDRPRVVMHNELMRFDWNFVMTPYSTLWRQRRTLFHKYFNERALRNYYEIQEQTTKSFLRRLLQNPEKFFDLSRLYFADTILRITYGIRVQGSEDEYVQVAERAMKIAVDGITQGRYLVNVIPILKYTPSWLPGTRFHRIAAEARRLSRDLVELPYAHVRGNMDLGFESGILADMLKKIGETASRHDAESMDTAIRLAKDAAASAYIGGADTTLSSIQALFMVLANNPGVQKMAQAEIDAAVGNGCLPTFHDVQHLPYINAIAKELLRWHNVAPLGLPHCLTQDDVYEGYFIPKGTTVLTNIWSILHDPETYLDPHMFNPSRWLVRTLDRWEIDNSIPDPESIVFGSGRRICPGRHLARSSLLIVISNLLACFDIYPLNEVGDPVDKIPERFSDGALIYPLPFKVSIIPRSEKVVDLIAD